MGPGQKIVGLAQIFDAINFNPIHHGGLPGVCFWHNHSLLAQPPSLEGDWQGTLDGPHLAVQCQFPRNEAAAKPGRLSALGRRNHPNRNG